MVYLSDIQRHVKGRLRIGEPLAKYTSFGIGGAADYFLEPSSKEDLVQAIAYFQSGSVPFILIGKGSNLLVSDEGYRGAALSLEEGLGHVRLENGPPSVKETLVYAEAGVRLASFVDFCVYRSLQGSEVLAGTRGTIGGWLATNMRDGRSSLTERVAQIEVLRDGTVMKMNRNSDGPSGILPDPTGDLILAATFRLTAGKRDEIMRSRRESLIRHNAIEPVNLAWAGSIFKNPPGYSAADLIEKVGLKGRRHGRAMISSRNANFIATEVGAKASDVLALIELMQRTVKQELHVMLELKVKLIGFEQHELQKVA